MCHHLHNINNFYKNNNAKNLNEEKNKENKNADRYNIISLTISNESADFSCKTIYYDKQKNIRRHQHN
jgi:hypothetical protein